MDPLDEMVEGYKDGRDKDAPEPSANRSHSYRHGFANGRHEVLYNGPRAPAAILRDEAAMAIQRDSAI